MNPQFHEKLRVAGVLRAEAKTRRLDEALQFRERASKFSLITTYSASGACAISLPAASRRRTITFCASWPRFFRRSSSASSDGGRMKISTAFRNPLLDLLRALPVDFEQHVVAALHLLLIHTREVA